MKKTQTIVSGLVAVTLLASNVAPLKVFAEEQNLSIISSQPSKDINPESIPKLNISTTTTSKADEPLDIWMPDKVVQEAVAKALKISVSEITKEKMAEITSNISFQGVGASNLKGLEYLTNASGIVVGFTDGTISDLSPLSDINVVQLNINNNKVSDLTPLRKLQLQAFWADHNDIAELDSVNCDNVNADYNHISNLSNKVSSNSIVARYQTITNAPIPKNSTIEIDSVKHAGNYELTDSDVFNISNNGSYTQNSKLNYGEVKWNNLDSSVTSLQYDFDRQYDWQDSMTNKIYFSGTVIQPLEDAPVATGSVQVKYNDEQGNEISTSQTISGNVGEAYDVSSSQYKIDIPGYTFKEIQGNATGNFTDQVQTVTYIYESSTAAPVTVRYEDKTGNEIAPSEELNGKIGDSYLAQAKNISGYALKTTPANAGGRFTDKPQSVTFIYSIDQTKLTTHDSTLYIGDKHYATDNLDSVVDEDGNPVDFKKVKVIGGDLMEHQSMGGDHLDIVETGTFDIQYGYGGKSATAIVIVKDNKTSIEAIDSTIYVGDTWNAKDNFTSASDKEGNSVDFKKITTSGSVDTTKTGSYDITYTNDNVSKTITVNVVENNSITVHYQDEKGNQISPDKVLKGKAGDSYSSDELKISGYTFKEVKGDASGKFTNNAQTVTYIYTKDLVKGAEVTVHYQDENGSEIAPDKILNGNLGSPYISEQLKIDGYTFKEVQGEISGNFTDKEQIVTYVYRKNPVKGTDINVHYQDEQGNKLASDDRLSGNIGDGYTSIKKEITGYTFKEVQGNVTGIFTDKTQTVIYIYSKDKVASVGNPTKSSEEDKDKEIISEKSNGKGTTEKTQSVDSVSEKQLPETGEAQLSVIATMLTGLVILSFSILMGRKQIKK